MTKAKFFIAGKSFLIKALKQANALQNLFCRVERCAAQWVVMNNTDLKAKNPALYERPPHVAVPVTA